MPSLTLQAPQDLPTKFDAAFGVALSRLQARYAPRPNPIISGAEVDGSDATDERPTDRELQEHFLTIKGWTRSDLWIDPLSGLTYLMADALDIQNRREDARNG